MTVYMLDSNVFNLIADDRLSLSSIQSKRCVYTHVQRDELSRTANPKRRRDLERVFELVAPSVVATETSVWNDSNWGQHWAKNDSLHDDMFIYLISLDKKSGKRSRGYNQSRDVRIAETALRNEYVPVTDDENLRSTVLHFGCLSIYPSELAPL
jgi:hypothetical protein